MKTKLALAAAFIAVTTGIVYGDAANKKTSAKIEVVFEKPESFTDVKDSTMDNERDRDSILGLLRDHLIETAPRYLTSDQALTITITDVDLAGDFEPWRGPRFDSVRIVKDLYPPKIDLSYKLTDASGAVVSEGKRQLRDMSFMLTASPIPSMDSLKYEKSMLNDWLRQDFRKTKSK